MKFDGDLTLQASSHSIFWNYTQEMSGTKLEKN